MVTDKIYTHDDWQTAPLLEMRHWHWRQAGNLTALPDVKDAQGTVQAYINWGRWIAECPRGHGDAVIASESFPYYICPVGGTGENRGQWYQVVFPANKTAIETELLKRVAQHPLKHAPYRNWKPVETLADLRAENQAHPERLK